MSDEQARFYALHHVGVFPSLHPEAFGIVAAEMMASGLAVVSTGVGGAGELIEHERTGLRYEAGNKDELSNCIRRLASDSSLLNSLRKTGMKEARQRFDVINSAKAIEDGFKANTDKEIEKIIF